MERQSTAALEARNVLFLLFTRSWFSDVIAYKVKESTLNQYLYVYDRYITKYKPSHRVKLQDVTPAAYEALLRDADTVYNTVDELPDWARPEVQEAIDLGILQGIGDGLGLTPEKLNSVLLALQAAKAFAGKGE